MVDDLGLFEVGLVREHVLEVGWYEAGHPSCAVDDVGCPTQLPNGFQHTPHEEEAALVVVFEELVVRVVQNRFALKVGVVVNEIHLDAGSGDGRHLDDQGVVCVVHIQVHAAQANDLVELVTTLVDLAETRHEHANLFALLVRPLGKHP